LGIKNRRKTLKELKQNIEIVTKKTKIKIFVKTSKPLHCNTLSLSNALCSHGLNT